MRFVFRHVAEEPRGVVSQHRCVACTAYARVTHADLPMRARCFFSFFFPLLISSNEKWVGRWLLK